MNNLYEIVGDNVILIRVWCKNVPYSTLINAEDLERICEFPNLWIAKETRGSFYAYGVMRDETGKRRMHSMHRWIMKPDSPKMVVDHINHNTLDNRRNNLRIVTRTQNGLNRKDRQGRVRGLSWSEAKQRWVVQLNAGGKRYYKEIDDYDEAKEYAEKLLEEILTSFGLKGTDNNV